MHCKTLIACLLLLSVTRVSAVENPKATAISSPQATPNRDNGFRSALPGSALTGICWLTDTITNRPCKISHSSVAVFPFPRNMPSAIGGAIIGNTPTTGYTSWSP